MGSRNLMNDGLGLSATTYAALRFYLLSRLCGAENIFSAFIEVKMKRINMKREEYFHIIKVKVPFFTYWHLLSQK